MKVSINQPAKTFQPINISITIETQREYEYMLSFFNASPAARTEMANKFKLNGFQDFSYRDTDNSNLADIFHELRNIQ